MSDQPRGAHLVGSVPLGSAEEVFRTMAGVLGRHLRRIPDGETGDRFKWAGWQGFAFQQVPQFDVVLPKPGQFPPIPRFRVRDGEDLAGARFGNLGYADEAVKSFAIFDELQTAGVIPAHTRFQVSLPTPLAPVSMFVVDDEQAAVEPVYGRAMRNELVQILDAIPHDRLAIQWDTCVEVWIWEGWIPSPFEDVQNGVFERMQRLSRWVPEDVEMGFHLCYGDYGHVHLREPVDSGNVVRIANGIAARSPRPVNWIHVPVPIDRTDDAYFQPFAELSLPEETEFYLGLVHFRDGVEGTQLRIKSALRHLGAFGVATECGMGRRPPERGGAADTLPELLETHAATSRPVIG
ncbi:MAG: hypothetical protein ACJ72N_02575 [Labedaea sp.]